MSTYAHLGVDICEAIQEGEISDYWVEEFLYWYSKAFPRGIHQTEILEEAFRFIAFKGYIAGRVAAYE